MKFKEYPEAQILNDEDALIIDTAEGTKHVLGSRVKGYTPSSIDHSRLFRGKNLGNAFTAEQRAAVQNGSFKDLFLGDYWEINNKKWRIVDMDYWLGTYDEDYNRMESHHLVIMPDTCLVRSAMKGDGTTTGGYWGSDLRDNPFNECINQFEAAFGFYPFIHGEYLSNAVTNGKVSGKILVNTVCEVPSEIMVYGTRIYSSANNDGTTIPNNMTYCKTQLALFNVAPQFIPDRKSVV